MNKHKNIIYLIGILITSIIGNNVWAIQDINLGQPTANIRLTHDTNNQHIVSISSEESVDNLNSGIDILWTVYRINTTAEQDFRYDLVARVKTDEELNTAIPHALPGAYHVILTVTNKDGVSNNAEKTIFIDSSRQIRNAQLMKIVLKKLLNFTKLIAKNLAKNLVQNLAQDLTQEQREEYTSFINDTNYYEIDPQYQVWYKELLIPGAIQFVVNFLSNEHKLYLLDQIKDNFLPTIENWLKYDLDPASEIMNMYANGLIKSNVNGDFAKEAGKWVDWIVR